MVKSPLTSVAIISNSEGDSENTIQQSRMATLAAKKAYESAVQRRSQSQKEVNDLLHRKSSWDDQDVSRFTALVREDHLYEQAEAKAKDEVHLSETNVDAAFDNLMRAILNRWVCYLNALYLLTNGM